MRVLPSLLVLVPLLAIGAPSTAPDCDAEPAEASDWVARIDAERELAEGLPEHQPRVTDEGIALGASGRITADGAHMATETDGEIGIELARFGRATLGAVDAGAPSIVGPEVRIARAPGVTEWWRSLPSGLEQGITLADRPSGEGSLHFELEAHGGAPSVEDGEVSIRDARGQELARYAHLMVRDARGASVPARLAVSDGRIRIDVDDADARYPLVVDPLLYTTAAEATLGATGGVSQPRTGTSVAASGDGSRVVVGASLDRSARVFLRTGTTWTEEATLRDPAPPAGAPNFGISVAMSADGARIVVGAPLNNNGGAAFVFVRSGTTWTRRQTLSRPGGVNGDRFGEAVAIGRDGMRIAVGAPYAQPASSSEAGAAHVFTPSGSTWSHLAQLTQPSPASSDHFGSSIAIDGSNRVLVGAPDRNGMNSNAGAAYLFRDDGVYSTTFQNFLVDPADTRLGWSVAAADGHYLIGFIGSSASGGGARYYDSILSGTPENLNPGGSGGDNYGYSVALTSIGPRLVAAIGGPFDDVGAVSQAGRTALMIRTGTTWTIEATLSSNTPGVNDLFGSSVGLAGDGSRAFVGAPFGDSTTANGGNVEVFAVELARALGEVCAVDGECISGFCIDGRCCDTACGGGDASDCVACAGALTGGTNGTCGALSAAVAPTVPCRDAVDLCDADDFCEGGNPVCNDRRRTASTPCRMAVGTCDQTEVCDGVSTTCPGDTLIAAGIVCRSDMGLCDVQEVCDGISGACPMDVVEAAGLLCQPSVGDCDVPDLCDGVFGGCIERFVPAGTVCDDTINGVCDAPDVCTGSTGNCPGVFLAGVECRAGTGACDAPELCSGSEASCPPDSLSAAGLVCRASIDTDCDPSEACSGVSSACPADLNMCVSPDAGPVGGDGGDAGEPPAATGCSCRVARADRGLPGVLALSVLALLVARRRRA